MTLLTVKGARLPAVGFGTSGLDGRRCTEIVREAIGLGYRHIDTAQAYGNEAAVGRGIADSGVAREEIFLATKVWMAHLDRRGIARTTDESLRKLGTGHVDLLLAHWPNDSIPLAETMEGLAAMRAAGKARFVGVCNYTRRHLAEAVDTLGAELVCNQVEYHPLLSQDAMLAQLRTRGMALVAYSPLGRGRIPRDAALARIGAKHGKSAAQVALAWLVRQDGVACIPKASSLAHARANLDIFDIALDADDLAAIAALDKTGRVIDPGWAPDWDWE